MHSRFSFLLRSAALAGALALSACGTDTDANLAAIDNELIGNDADPALTSALEDQILVDPALVQQSNPNSVRPPETPVQAQYPVGAAPGQPTTATRPSPAGAPVAQPQAGQAQTRPAQIQRASMGAAPGAPSPPNGPAPVGACGAAFEHGPHWAGRLPPEFPLYPGARVTEAAGNNAGDCRVRVVTFRTGDRHDRVLDHYRSLAARGGFSAEHQVRGADHVLGGTNSGSNGAYYLIVTPVTGGSDVALIVNNGR